MLINQKSVAVVDDDSSMRQAIERLLNAAGFSTLTFSSAETFLQSSPAAGAACLVFDIHLPGLSGFELQERLVQTGVVHPVIFISAYDDPDSQSRAAALGAIAYIKKPFQGQRLIAAIRRVFGESSDNTK